MWPDVAGRRGRPTAGQGGTQRGLSDVAGAARGREGGAAYAARASVWLNRPDGSSSGPPTARAAGSEAAHRSAAQRAPARLTVMSSPSRRRPRPSGSSTLNVHLDLQTGRVTAIGRLDGRSAPLLHDAVSVLLGTERPTLTVDVSGMEVADSIFQASGGQELPTDPIEMTSVTVSEVPASPSPAASPATSPASAAPSAASTAAPTASP